MAEYPEFSKWLYTKYLEWQQHVGGRKTLTEFAAWLDIGNATVNQWINGQARPRPEFAFRLAQRLGLEVYQILGLPSPDPLLFEVQRNWSKFTDEDKALIGKLLEEQQKRDEAKTQKQPSLPAPKGV
jgi:transcriptional regulator with XRE-family HTH domain